MIQIALGIVLAVIILAFLPAILELLGWLLGIAIGLVLLLVVYTLIDNNPTILQWIVLSLVLFLLIGLSMSENKESDDNKKRMLPTGIIKSIIKKIKESLLGACLDWVVEPFELACSNFPNKAQTF